MLDINGKEFKVGDFIRGDYSSGEVCNITQEGHVMYIDKGNFIQTIWSQEESLKGNFMIYLRLAK